MNSIEKKAHWENIYTTKRPQEFSWYQEVPTFAMRFLSQARVSKKASILDVGGGDGFFVDYLLENGYSDITVSDISSMALERAQKRLGSIAQKVTWSEGDILAFASEKIYDFWYDRAVFHFLTTTDEVNAYVKKVTEILSPEGVMIVGTFSPNGPQKCSGIPVKQYSEKEIQSVFSPSFVAIDFEREIHQTPFDTSQEFLFSQFRLKH